MLLANKKQNLISHSVAVAHLASEIALDISNDPTIQTIAFYSGLYHDTGKSEPSFQSYINNKPEDSFSFKDHPRHNEVSVFFCSLLVNPSDKDDARIIKKYVNNVVMWHHERPIRNKDCEIETTGDVYRILKKKKLLKDTIKNANLFIEQVAQHIPNHHLVPVDARDIDIDDFDVKLPEFNSYSAKELEDFANESFRNSKITLARSCMVSADRIISALSSEELEQLVSNKNYKDYLPKFTANTNIKQGIEDCLTSFEERYPSSERNIKQTQAVDELNEIGESVTILGGAAGVGKTKIALQYLNDNKQLVWICPRTQVCQSIYDELASSEYLPNCDIELLTGSVKQHSNSQSVKEWTGDVVVTTLDQVLNITTTHKQINALVHIMNCNIVVDEFHEFISIDCLNLLFAELVHCLKTSKKTKTLLVSATPHPLFCEQILELEDITVIDSFNQSEYAVSSVNFKPDDYSENNPLYAKQRPSTLVISNTATTAQRSFLLNAAQENSILFHSRYTKEDRQHYFDEVMSSFGKKGTGKYDVLRSSPISQASLNVTTNFMVTEATSAENWLQRFGRADRFGNLKGNEVLTCFSDHPHHTGFLRSMFMLTNSKLWLKEIKPLQKVKVNELYDLYYEFHSKHQEALTVELEAALEQSKLLLKHRLIEPKMIKLSSKKVDKLKANGLRGRSRYVQMAELAIDGATETLKEYVCTEDSGITLGIEVIETKTKLGDIDTNKDLIHYHDKKTHQVRPEYSKPYSRSVSIANATYADKPIFVSYTNEDMDKANMKQHKQAIFYVTHPKQAIGVANWNRLQG